VNLLVTFAALNLEHLVDAVDYPLPQPRHTRFYLLTSNGVLRADAPEREFGENRHVLSPLSYAAQELITEIRASEGID
jgi:hypothetical protein